MVARRGPAYESELPLEGTSGVLRVRGRADGYDAARNSLEEIKTIRGEPDDIPENRRQLHWAQLETYGALLCRTRGLAEVHLALVYVDAATQAETVLRQLASAADLDAAFERRCTQFTDWALQEAAHRHARDAALAELPFPPGEFRPGQRLLAESVYRAAVSARSLLAQAPTGIGKTLGTLYPMLRAMPVKQLDRIAYLTCKGTARLPALDALHRLREATPGRALRVLAIVSKEQACEHPDKACHGDACPLAQGFYDRLPAARAEGVEAGWLDPAAQRRIALAHGICPYYLGQELLRWVDVMVGDVHHLFDPNGQLFGLQQALGWRMALLVDEAHNLVERTRQMYSAAMSLGQMRVVQQLAPAALRPHLGRLIRAVRELALTQEADYQALETVPDALADALQALTAAFGEHFQKQPLATGALLNFYFEALGLQRVLERFGTHSLLDVQRQAGTALSMPAPRRRTAEVVDANLPLLPADETVNDETDVATATASATVTANAATVAAVDDDNEEEDDLEIGNAFNAFTDATLSVRNIVPGGFLKPRFEACHGAALFSATLGPEDYPRAMLGLPDDTVWLDVPPAFAPEHLVVQIADRMSTRFPHRQASLTALVDLMARQYEGHPGNYLAFFSSFDYLEQAAERLALRHPALPQWRQSRAMGEGARAEFLARFRPHGRGIGFAVLGGAFAEGVDLPGTRLIGAFIASLGLPPVSPVQEQVRLRMDTLFGPGHGYADLVPGLQKVVQAAGRVIRSETDQGFLMLADARYRDPRVRERLPRWWAVPPGLSAS